MCECMRILSVKGKQTSLNGSVKSKHTILGKNMSVAEVKR